MALTVAFAFVFVSRGLSDIWMVFLLPIEGEFHATRQQTTGVYSTYMLTTGLSAPLAALLLRRLGARISYGLGLTLITVATLFASRATQLWQLYLCVGVLSSVGLSMIGIVPASALIGHWFQLRMPTAMAVVYAGLGSGALLLVPLAQWSIQQQGWRETYETIGIAVAVLLVGTMLLPWRRIWGMPVEAPAAGSGTWPAGVGDGTGSAVGVLGVAITLRQAVARREFAGLTATFALTGFSMYMVSVQVIPLLVESGHAQLKAAATFGMTGMISVAGVMASGWLSDRFGLRPIALLSFSCSFVGILCLLGLSYENQDWLLFAFVAIYGVSQGARGPIVASLSNQLFRGPAAPSIYGVIYATSMVGAGIGAWASGFLHDVTASYRAGLLVAAVGIVLAAMPFALLRELRAPQPLR